MTRATERFEDKREAIDFTSADGNPEVFAETTGFGVG